VKVLQVFHNGQLMGTLEQNRGGQNYFTYSDLWQPTHWPCRFPCPCLSALKHTLTAPLALT
jgi:hypothetical protein